jgi:glycine betaine/proline transport system substrate-binding protein
MKDHWDLFKDPEDPTKGIFINAIIGWSNATLNEAMLKAYGLDKYYNIMTPGSPGAETAALAGPQKKKQPVFGYYWAPTALMGMYEWHILEEPANDPAVWAKVTAAALETNIPTIEKACAYPDNPLPIVINTGLRKKAPDVVAMFEKMTIGLDRCNKVLSWVDENGVKDWDKAAVYFFRQYDSHWKTWVTPDAYTKIKAAVDAYGPVP